MPDSYITVRVPKSLRDLFEDLNRHHGLGYMSFAEFTKEAIRARLEEVKKVYNKKTKDPY